LWLGVRTPRLLLLGFLRFAVVAMLTVVVSSLILAKHGDILALLWQQPQSPWIVWIWYLASWLLHPAADGDIGGGCLPAGPGAVCRVDHGPDVPHYPATGHRNGPGIT
jgi:hypothetical protein